jgi:hypothetical protein
MTPATLTILKRLSTIANVIANRSMIRIAIRKELDPANAAGKEIKSSIKRKMVIWLPVRPRRNSSLSSKDAESSGSGGEAIRYHNWRIPAAS